MSEQQKQEPQPAQHQKHQPGMQSKMVPSPRGEARAYRAAGKLEGRKALVSGGDSGIGRAVAIAFAKEGADVAILYLDEDRDAEDTRALIEAEGRKALAIAGDIGDPQFAARAVAQVVDAFGGLDVLVNNAAEQHPQEHLEDITPQQLERTFRTNIFGMFFLTQAALPHMPDGASIVNTASVTAYKGKKELIDYAATKGAIVAFTRSLAENLKERRIRVNAVAPGPVWTPLIPASYTAEQVAEFGAHTLHKRPAQPDEIAPAYVYLASDDGLFMSGQTMHPNGGTVVAG